MNYICNLKLIITAFNRLLDIPVYEAFDCTGLLHRLFILLLLLIKFVTHARSHTEPFKFYLL